MLDITVRTVRQATKQMKDWKSPGPDMVHAYWLKKLTSLHEQIAQNLNAIVKGDIPSPGWLADGTTSLQLKDVAKGSQDPANYRPITCLSTTWKLLSSILASAIGDHLNQNGILAKEQKGCTKGSRGTKDQLMMDKTIMRDSRSRKTNLSACWIDYKKAYDSIPHSWILECLAMYKVNTRITQLIEESMSKWNTTLTINGKTLGQVKINRGIFQGDSISGLLFCLGMNPLSSLLQQTKKGYVLQSKQLVSHLFYMDDLKMYGKNEKELDCLIQTVRIFSKDIEMEFGFDKCAKLHLQRGKAVVMDDLQVPGGTIKALHPDQTYKYLGMLESADIDHAAMKEKITKEYVRRLRKILASRLNGGNKIKAINSYAVPLVTYSAGIIEWTKAELQQMDRKTRKHLTMYGTLHPKADVDRLYVQRYAGGRGLCSIEDMVEKERLALKDYVETKAESDHLIRIVQAQGEHIRKINTDETAKQFKLRRRKERYQAWTQKELHGQYLKSLDENVCKELTFSWLTESDLKPGTEALIIAAQDQALNTNAHKSKILKLNVDSRCRMCKQHDETVAHIVSGCQTLANDQYKKRHNHVAKRLHWTLCRRYGIETPEQWWKHDINNVIETNETKILWDFSIRTDRVIQAHKPDIVVVDKKTKKCQIIDVACPLDMNVAKKEMEKITKYQDLRIEIERLWGVKAEVVPVVIGALGAVTKKHEAHVRSIDENIRLKDLQKAALLGTARILREVLQLPGL
jgi:hypothetical protein